MRSPIWAKTARVVARDDSVILTSRTERSSGRMLPMRSRSVLMKSVTFVRRSRIRVW